MTSHLAALPATAELADLLASFETVDLSHALELGIPAFPTHPKYAMVPYESMGDVAEFKQLLMCDHSGTHIDSPSHFVRDHSDSRRVHTDELSLSQLMGRAVVMHLGPYAEKNHAITLAEIKAWERENTEILPGDIVIIDADWAKHWRLIPEGFDYLRGWPGLSGEAAIYLRERGVKAVGIDCVSIDPDGVAGDELHAHYELLPFGVLVIENLTRLRELPLVCYFAALPLKLAGGTGSPVRAIAFVPREVTA